ncbi:MAG TPA: glyoxalase/bleomycin resistance/extradiol dioxygenase family protein [Paracoccus sp.]|nr:glyoxalase/bleomycin resistance/extradiol dioxygenase family protein [Paracoccus sp. (in: a-proteobacteria)]
MRHNDLPPAPIPRHALEVALYAEDLERCAAFYAQVIGLERGPAVPGRHAFFRLGEGMLLLFNPRATRVPTGNPDMPVPPHGAAGEGHLCFATERAAIRAWRDRLRAAGVAIEAEFDWPNGARSLYCRDPAGNSLEFAEPRLWERNETGTREG